MKISEEVTNRVRIDYDGGMTQDQIAKKYNVTQQRINHILSGKRLVSAFSIKVLETMFPRCRIDLDGNSYISSADHGGVSVQDISVSGNGNNFFSAENSRITKITDAVMTSDLPAESKVKVYQIIKDCE